MTAFVDTNVLIRHVMADDSRMAARATALLREYDNLLLTDLVVAEMVYVLESVYEVGREQVGSVIRAVLAMPNIRVVDVGVLARAIEVYEVHRLDFAEAYLVACAESTGVDTVASFDRSLDRVKTIERVRP